MSEYLLTLRLPIQKADDVEARTFALKVREYCGMGLTHDATWKLQEVFSNKPPRHIELPEMETIKKYIEEQG